MVTAFLLSVHVLAAIVLIGPVTVAASLFPRYARQALHQPEQAVVAGGVVRALHRISAGYSVAGVAVPVFGIATAVQLGVLGQAWVLVSMVLTGVAAALLAAIIIPGQRRVIAVLGGEQPGSDQPGSAPGVGGLGLTPPGRVDVAAATKAKAADATEVTAVTAVVRRLSMVTGLFALTWTVVVVLMILRPGSTTGV